MRIAREMAPQSRQSANPANPCSGRSGPTNTASASTSSPSIAASPSSATSILSATRGPRAYPPPALRRLAGSPEAILSSTPFTKAPVLSEPYFLPSSIASLMTTFTGTSVRRSS